jgi:RsiW-degrading membrane proteinase PrsW (M82 family)
MTEWLRAAGPVAASLLPVPAFLGALRLLDSYKLVTLSRTLRNVGVGCLVAALCYGINSAVFAALGGSPRWYLAFAAPAIEEILKAVYLLWLVRANRVGFMVDAAITGFAIGAGFALVENIAYLAFFAGSSPLLWILRGFGTATMHGANTAIVGIVATVAVNPRFRPAGLALAFAIHSAYNQELLSPLGNALALLLVVPIVLALVFMKSEASLQKWIGDRLDKDVDLLHAISTGQFIDTHAAHYLRSLKSSFAPEVVGDMLCLLQLSLELSARAKGDLMMREAGFDAPPDPSLPAKLKELRYLEKSIGPTGRRAMAPLISPTARELWEIEMLRDTAHTATTPPRG